MQRGATVNAHNFCGFLKFTLAGLVVFTIIIIIFKLVVAMCGPVLLLLGLAAATSSATAFLAGPLSTTLGLLLISPFILSFLLLGKLFNLPAVLEIMALGAMNLAILLVGAIRLVGNRQGMTRGTPGNLLSGVVNLDLLGGVGVAGSLDGKHGLSLTLPVVSPPTFLCQGDVFTF